MNRRTNSSHHHWPGPQTSHPERSRAQGSSHRLIHDTDPVLLRSASHRSNTAAVASGQRLRQHLFWASICHIMAALTSHCGVQVVPSGRLPTTTLDPRSLHAIPLSPARNIYCISRVVAVAFCWDELALATSTTSPPRFRRSMRIMAAAACGTAFHHTPPPSPPEHPLPCLPFIPYFSCVSAALDLIRGHKSMTSSLFDIIL